MTRTTDSDDEPQRLGPRIIPHRRLQHAYQCPHCAAVYRYRDLAEDCEDLHIRQRRRA